MSKEYELKLIETNVKNCTKCRLCKTAKKAVPGEGNWDANIVIIGEAPGAKEDETGRPFVGRAGNLLEKLLDKIHLSRDDVWIGNVIKHRPPQNRDPLPDEIKTCEQYLTMQLNIIQPLLIVTLGRFAMNHFYKQGKISQDRGKLIKTDHYNVYPVYHPAAALRNGNFAKALIADFVKIPGIIERLKSENAFEDNSPIGAKSDLNTGLGI